MTGAIIFMTLLVALPMAGAFGFFDWLKVVRGTLDAASELRRSQAALELYAQRDTRHDGAYRDPYEYAHLCAKTVAGHRSRVIQGANQSATGLAHLKSATDDFEAELIKLTELARYKAPR